MDVPKIPDRGGREKENRNVPLQVSRVFIQPEAVQKREPIKRAPFFISPLPDVCLKSQKHPGRSIWGRAPVFQDCV